MEAMEAMGHIMGRGTNDSKKKKWRAPPLQQENAAPAGGGIKTQEGEGIRG